MGCSSNMTPSQTLLPVPIEMVEKSGDLSTSCYTDCASQICYTDLLHYSCFTDCATQMGDIGTFAAEVFLSHQWSSPPVIERYFHHILRNTSGYIFQQTKNLGQYLTQLVVIPKCYVTEI